MLTRLTPEEPGLLAHHFDLGGEIKQALFWYEQTTQQTEALFAWKEAEQYQNRMLSLLDQLDPHENQPDNILRRGSSCLSVLIITTSKEDLPIGMPT